MCCARASWPPARAPDGLPRAGCSCACSRSSRWPPSAAAAVPARPRGAGTSAANDRLPLEAGGRLRLAGGRRRDRLERGGRHRRHGRRRSRSWPPRRRRRRSPCSRRSPRAAADDPRPAPGRVAGGAPPARRRARAADARRLPAQRHLRRARPAEARARMRTDADADLAPRARWPVGAGCRWAWPPPQRRRRPPAAARRTPPAGGKAASAASANGCMRMHEASRQRSYVGTFVVSSSNGSMSSARIWHACDGDRQVERVESLTGRAALDLPAQRRGADLPAREPRRCAARSASRSACFPNLLKSERDRRSPSSTRRAASAATAWPASMPTWCSVLPKDSLRFGYRIWSEKKSGPGGQAADARRRRATCSSRRPSPNCSWTRRCAWTSSAQMMAAPDGWRVEKAEAVEDHRGRRRLGARRPPVAGFKPMSCYKRPAGGARRRRDAVDLLGRPGLGVAVRRALRPAAPRRRKACSPAAPPTR